VIVFTTVPESEMSATEVLEHYRSRWQIELVFKRLKSILAIGHLPKYDDQSSRSWLYGKTPRGAPNAEARVPEFGNFPWGYDVREAPDAQSLA
jgi:Transposase DDE domain